MDNEDEMAWYGVRCLFRHPLTHEQTGKDPVTYEERVTIWQARSFDEAIAKAEVDADNYASMLDCEKTDLVQAYLMELAPKEGSEVFSLMRDSSLNPSDYIDKYFDNGAERQRTT